MCNSISGVKYDTCGASRSVKRENSLYGDVEGGCVECFEHDLSHFFAVRFWVQRGLGEQHGVLLGGHTQFVIEGMMPDLFHVIPISDDTMLYRVLESENSTLRLSFVAGENIGF